MIRVVWKSLLSMGPVIILNSVSIIINNIPLLHYTFMVNAF